MKIRGKEERKEARKEGRKEGQDDGSRKIESKRYNWRRYTKGRGRGKRDEKKGG